MKKKRQWAWVSRDVEVESDCVSIWLQTSKPRFDVLGFYPATGKYTLVCVKVFTAMTGITIKPGQCLKVDFSGCKVIS